MKRAALITLACLWPFAASTNVAQAISPDPLGELNTLYGKICKWPEDTTIPYEVVDITKDGKPDYILSYDLPCRGQAKAFEGEHGLARQIWVSVPSDTGDKYVRILDANARDLKLETRNGATYVVLQHAGSYCLSVDAAPCFLTLVFRDNALVWADDADQHPSMQARIKAERAKGAGE